MKPCLDLARVRRPLAVVAFLAISGVCANSLAGDRVKIAIWGDLRENLDSATENIGKILLNDVTDWDFMIHTGDFTSTGKAKSWERSLAVPGMDRMFEKGRFLMCTSNHDREADAFDQFTKGVLPTNSADGSTHFFGYKFKKRPRRGLRPLLHEGESHAKVARRIPEGCQTGRVDHRRLALPELLRG